MSCLDWMPDSMHPGWEVWICSLGWTDWLLILVAWLVLDYVVDVVAGWMVDR